VSSEIKVLLVDDPRSRLDSVKNLIQSQEDLEVVRAVLNPVEILLEVTKISADVVIIGLLDIKDEPGIISHLLAEYPNLLIIAVSMTDNLAHIYRQRISKDERFNISDDEILSAVRSIKGYGGS
jgi:DNA-binding NarL/FixJ family response regulator